MLLVKKGIVKAGSLMANLIVRAYLPPGFDTGVLGTMLVVSLASMSAALRALREIPFVN